MAPRRKNVLPKTKTPEEWAALFRCIETRYPTAARNHAMLYLTYLAGLRIGETLALRVGDVDLDRLKVYVRHGKTGERIVPLPGEPMLAASLERWVKVRGTWPTSELLFITRTGEPIRSSAVRRSMALYGVRSGIGHVTPHMLRHSAATEMLANGASPIGVQQYLDIEVCARLSRPTPTHPTPTPPKRWLTGSADSVRISGIRVLCGPFRPSSASCRECVAFHDEDRYSRGCLVICSRRTIRIRAALMTQRAYFLAKVVNGGLPVVSPVGNSTA